MNSKRKVLVIGLDGFSPELMLSLTKRGVMRTVGGLLKKGAWGTLLSSCPPITGPAWVSFATGKNPGKHGVFDFVKPEKSLSRLRIVSSRDIVGTTFYELLERAGKKCVLINLPISHPPRLKEGVVIASLTSPSPESNYPRWIRSRVPELKEYRIAPNSSLLLRGKRKEYVRDIRELEAVRFRVAARALKEVEWDFFFLLFSGTDLVQHVLYDKLLEGSQDEVVREALSLYSDIDSYINELLRMVPKETITILMSDHGFKAFKGIFYVNEWLRQRDYLKAKVREEEEAPFTLFPESKKATRSLPGFAAKLAFTLMKTPLRRLSPVGMKLLGRLGFRISASMEVDVRRSRALMPTTEAMGLYINDDERFEDGIVSAEEARSLKEELLESLREVKIGGGEPAFKEVLDGLKLYRGRMARMGPDIVFRLGNYGVRKSIYPGTLWRGTPPSAIEHEEEGIIIAFGEGISAKRIRASIMDIAPTVLEIMGVTPPPDLDGRAIPQIVG